MRVSEAVEIEKQEYILALRRETGEILAAAREGMEAAVPSCPEWQVGDVLVHVGRAMNWMREVVETRTQSPFWARDDHGFDWHAPEATTWFEESRDAFLAIMEKTDPEEPMWSWAGDHRAIFWLRLEAMEAGIHRWDAQGAHRTSEPIDTALAEDGIDATIRWFLPVWRRRTRLKDENGHFRFDQTDGPGRWAVHVAGETVLPGSGRADADVFAVGTASDVLLFLWNRIPASALSAAGDAGLLHRFALLMPPG